ncbi:Wzz/FepE/Etk N-terminal domain-containing protein [Afipia sp. TerB]
MSDYVGEPSSLRTFGLRSLQRRWKFIAACGALFFIAGLVVAILKPVSYRAFIQLLVYVRELQPGPEPVVSHGRVDLVQVENEIEIIRSRGVLAKVVRSLNLADDAEFVPAMTPLRKLTEWISHGQKAAFDQSRTREDTAIETLGRHMSVMRVGTSHTILVSVTTSSAEKSKQIASAIGQTVLQARIGVEQEGGKSPLLRERLQGLGPNAYVITTAVAPDRPSGPRKIIVILGMTIVGVVFGSALALLQDFRNRTIRTAAQVEYLGLECIGPIPLLRRWMPKSPSPPCSLREPVEDDEFRPNPMFDQTLSRIAVAIEAAKARTVGVASAVAGEGAATMARHLARTAACSHKKVLLVVIKRNEPNRPSRQEASPAESAADRAAAEGGIILNQRAGPDVLVVDGLNGVGGAATWWMHLGKDYLGSYDLIVLSLPPLEEGPEFRTAAKNLDGILLVLKWGGVDLERIERAIAVSGVAPSEFIGAVLNMVDERMIGKFGDKFWKAEATFAARRHAVERSMPAAQATG